MAKRRGQDTRIRELEKEQRNQRAGAAESLRNVAISGWVTGPLMTRRTSVGFSRWWQMRELGRNEDDLPTAERGRERVRDQEMKV